MEAATASPYGSNEALLWDLRRFAHLAIDDPDPRNAQLDELWAEIVARIAATLQQGTFLPWIHVAVIFRLTSTDQKILCLALLAELDGSAAQHSRAHGVEEARARQSGKSDASVVRSPPSVSLEVVHRLLGNIHANFLPDAPLVQGLLIDVSDANAATLTGSYRLSGPLFPYLMAIAAPQMTIDDTALPDIVEACALDDHLIDEQTKRQLRRFIELGGSSRSSPMMSVLHLEGADVSLIESLCAATFGALGYVTAKLDARLLRRAYERADSRYTALTKQLRVLCRDALLCSQVLLLTNSEALIASDVEGHARDDILETVLQTIAGMHSHLIILNGPASALDGAFRHSALFGSVRFRIRIAMPDANLRRQAWLKHSGRYDLPLEEGLLDQLAKGFCFTEERIAHVAKETAAAQSLGDRPDGNDDLLIDACRAQAEDEQLSLASVLRWPYRMADIVVPEATREMLDELMNHVKHRHRVVEEWGFGHKYAGTRNLSALLFGPSGTGKTMAASIVANELRLSLYRVDLANVLNKYIGETEKNLARLFDRAADMNVVLFFDEAEGLFAKRSDSRDANDRFVNLQVGYILQRIETYPGLVVLATNLLGNIDKAFLRRFRFVIEFPFPAPAERRLLWQNAFPRQTPLSEDIDFDLLAHRAVLAGGSIQTAALSAAMNAAQEGLPISMRHVARAVKREYTKLGKLFSGDDLDVSSQT
jgi:SpoVK/Ycf46/Vps4 family AAA+-type ATPase